MRNETKYLSASINLTTQPFGQAGLSDFEIVHAALSSYRDLEAETLANWSLREDKLGNNRYQEVQETISCIDELMGNLFIELIYADRKRVQLANEG